MLEQRSSLSLVRWARLGALLLSLLTLSWVGAAPVPEGGKTATPRYLWKEGQTHVYSVTVEVDQGDYLDILSGTPSFTVGKADQDGIQVTFRGALRERQQAKPGKRILFGPSRISPFSPFTGVGSTPRSTELKISSRGEILSVKGSSQLPYLLGNLSQLLLEPLPKENEKAWKVTRDIAITQSEGRLGRPIVRPADQKQLKATWEVNYTIDQTRGDTAIIAKKTELRTAETVGGKPRFEIVGEGQLTFDLKNGLTSKLEFQQKLFVREANATEETPIKITATLLDEAERARLAKTAEGAPLFPNQPLGDDLQKQALADLKSGDKLRTLKALNLLQTKDPEKPNKELAQALEGLLTDKDQSLRFLASRALVKWAGPDSVLALTRALEDENISVRHNAMDALGRLKAEAATEPMARKLTSSQDRFKATQALQAMGSTAEAAVLKLADDKEWMVRSEVCKILKVIGTQKSVPALTALQNDPQALVKRQAKEALDAIAARQ